jgi:hypothetical protein
LLRGDRNPSGRFALHIGKSLLARALVARGIGGTRPIHGMVDPSTFCSDSSHSFSSAIAIER